MKLPCIKCKGRYPENCGRSFCPILAKNNALFHVQRSVSAHFDASSPNVFVGRIGYPYLNVGILAPPGVSDSSDYDNALAEEMLGISSVQEEEEKW